ncbi:phage antirepressor N-terminal domain-containing protein [Mycobacterium canetti]|uniref:phage antirepressor N-terminal domain-containing protein n=1 Tax=Mycobacterium canetti TaxID=78331 RepID=UPI001E57C92A|nr:phage antirepressor N-terminal domain-containing protein [Mycobacterium canetti]
MSADLMAVPVPGTDVPMHASIVGDEPFVALKPMCEAIGIDVDTQRRKLDQAEWARTVLMTVHDSTGRLQRMVGVHADCIPMWLATITSSRVAEHARPILTAYQREAARALRDYFYRGVAVQQSSMNQLDVLRAAIDQIEATQRDAAEAKALAERTEARVDAIEGQHGWVAALGYAKINGLPTYSKFLAKLGTHASMIARSHGIEPVKTPHQLYGTVNSYPTWIWELAAEGFRR